MTGSETGRARKIVVMMSALKYVNHSPSFEISTGEGLKHYGQISQTREGHPLINNA